MQERQARMSTSFPDAPVWLQADPPDLSNIRESAFNAAVHRSGWPIRLSAETEQGEAVVRIRDGGIGIEPKDLPMFTLFAQTDPSSRRSEAGMGIRLALVHSGRTS